MLTKSYFRKNCYETNFEPDFRYLALFLHFTCTEFE